MTDEANAAVAGTVGCDRLRDVDATTARALLEESAKRAGLIWLRGEGSSHLPQPVWHAWIAGSVYVLTGGIEQPMPPDLAGPGARAEVTVPSKDKRSRLLVWVADVAPVAPGSDGWQAAVPVLQAKRLNSPDGETAPQRWAAECTLLRLIPTGEVLEEPESASTVTAAGSGPPRPAPRGR